MGDLERVIVHDQVKLTPRGQHPRAGCERREGERQDGERDRYRCW
jgi:hypothetical protein